MSYQIKDFIQELNFMPGIEEFIGMIDTEDKTFDMIYPTVREAFLEQFNDPAFKTMRRDILGTTGYEQMVTVMPGALEKLKAGKTVSANKIQFLELLCDLLTEEPYDAEVFVELMDGAQLPAYAHLTDAGADIYAKEDMSVNAGELGFIIPVGLKMAIPNGWQLAIRPRSGMSAKTSMRIANAPGTIDSDFRNEVGVIMDNFDDEPYYIKKGDRIAQFILERVYRAKYTTVESVAEIGNDRQGGFGSSGK